MFWSISFLLAHTSTRLSLITYTWNSPYLYYALTGSSFVFRSPATTLLSFRLNPLQAFSQFFKAYFIPPLSNILEHVRSTLSFNTTQINFKHIWMFHHKPNFLIPLLPSLFWLTLPHDFYSWSCFRKLPSSHEIRTSKTLTTMKSSFFSPVPISFQHIQISNSKNFWVLYLFNFHF